MPTVTERRDSIYAAATDLRKEAIGCENFIRTYLETLPAIGPSVFLNLLYNRVQEIARLQGTARASWDAAVLLDSMADQDTDEGMDTEKSNILSALADALTVANDEVTNLDPALGAYNFVLATELSARISAITQAMEKVSLL